jgi:hypothetical protein
MKTSAESRTASRNRRRGEKLPLAAFHAPRPGEDVELFSDRTEDAVEYESIMHRFALLRAAETASDNGA